MCLIAFSLAILSRSVVSLLQRLIARFFSRFAAAACGRRVPRGFAVASNPRWIFPQRAVPGRGHRPGWARARQPLHRSMLGGLRPFSSSGQTEQAGWVRATRRSRPEAEPGSSSGLIRQAGLSAAGSGVGSRPGGGERPVGVAAHSVGVVWIRVVLFRGRGKSIAPELRGIVLFGYR